MSTSYPVMEHFYSIQGEGANTGNPAYFVRLGGCDVGCVWCDVKESWPFDVHPNLSTQQIEELVRNAESNNVVVTGGEPTLHQLDALTTTLKNAGCTTWLETAGTNNITGNWDWICLSPKKFKLPVDNAYAKADELKVVVYNKHDLKWAEEQAEKVGPSCQLFLQPEWDKSKTVLPLIIEFVKANPKWKISLQTHKYLDVR